MRRDGRRNETEYGEPTPGTANSLQHSPANDLKTRHFREHSLWAIGSALVAVGLLEGCTRTAGGSRACAAKTPVAEVPVQRVSERQLPLRFEFTGHTIAVHEVEVRPRVSGLVTRASFEEGGRSESGRCAI